MSRRRPTSNPFSLFSFQDIITATTGILILLALILALSVVIQSNLPDASEPNPATAELVKRRDLLKQEVNQLSTVSLNISSSLELMVGLTPQELKNKLESLAASIETLNTRIAAKTSDNAKQNGKLQSQVNSPESLAEAKKLAELNQKVSATIQEIQNLKKDNRVVYNFRQTTSPPWLVEINGSEMLVARAGVKQKAQRFVSAAKLVEFSRSLTTGKRYFVLLVKPSGIATFDLLKDGLEAAGAEIGVELLAEDEKAIDKITGAEF